MLKFTNNASATLAGGITASATSIILTPGNGSLFPALAAGEFCYATLVDSSNNLEVVKVTGRSSDTLTVTRAQDNTTSRAYAAGDKLELRLVAAVFSELIQRDGSVAMSAALSLGGFKATNVADPTASQDAATKNYVDSTAVAAVNAEAATRAAADAAEVTARNSAITSEATARAAADALLLPKAGGTMTGDLYGVSFRSNRTSENARATGFQLSNGTDIGECDRSTQYYDDRASNCNGYLPNGNCAGNSAWNPPNGNWWTWGVSGVPTGNCGNPSGFDFAGGSSNTLYPVSVSFNYDGYYQASDEIGGLEYRRNYRNCNCGNCVGNCYTNCNCNCNCNCACSTDSCFLPETLVRMADGSTKEIASIQIGEFVETFGGGQARVKALWQPILGDRTLYSFGGHVVTTEDHLVLNHNGKWSCLNPTRFAQRRYMSPVMVTQQGKQLFNSVVSPEAVELMDAGSGLMTNDGTTLSVDSITPVGGYGESTRLYTLLTDSGNFVLSNGVVVDGMWQAESESSIPSTANQEEFA